jgi:hypothetical protein
MVGEAAAGDFFIWKVLLHWLDYPNRNTQAMLAFRLVLLVVVTNNSRSMQTSKNGPSEILQTNNEALNLG